MLVAALALALQPAAPAEDPLAPLRFLSGRCWRGTFGDGPAYDVMCAEDMPGGHLRTRHLVRGVDTDYRGETIYHHDGLRQRLRYHYYTSLGALAEGDIEVDGDVLRFVAGRYVFPDGTLLPLTGSQRRLPDGGVAHESYLHRDGRWERQTDLVIYPIDCTDWDAVLAGCD